MPIYDYECPNCGKVMDVWAHIDDQEKLHFCGNWMKRLISLANINPDFQPYLDENLGQDPVYVKSRQHRKQLMSERGLVDKHTSTTRQRWV